MKLLLVSFVVACLFQRAVATDANPCIGSCRDGLVCSNGTCQYVNIASLCYHVLMCCRFCETNLQCVSINSQSQCRKIQFMRYASYQQQLILLSGILFLTLILPFNYILSYSLPRTIEHLCLHKTLFGSKFSWNDMVSFIIFFVAAAISAGGGVGGGGILSLI